MSGSIDVAVGGSVPLSYRLGDKTYQFAKLTVEEWSAFCQWIKDGRREDIAEVKLSESEKRQLYREVLANPVEPDEMFRHALTLPGLRWLIHRSFSKHNPGIAIETVGELVGGIEQMTELFGLIADLPSVDDSESADPLVSPQAAD